jgi:hypothetical protein
LFGADCQEHRGFGLKQVVKHRYVTGDSSEAIQVSLLAFATEDGALASFARRVIGDADPARASLSPIPAGSIGVLGEGVAHIVSGKQVWELRYADRQKAPKLALSSARLTLGSFGEELAAALGPSSPLPAALALLPLENRLPVGVSYLLNGALGIDGTGPAAIGYYRKDRKRWRVLSLHHADPEMAKDAALTLRKAAGVLPRKRAAYDSFRLTFPAEASGLSVEWVIARQLGQVWGVGDEEHALDPSLSDSEIAASRLSYLEKLETLRQLLQLSSKEN